MKTDSLLQNRYSVFFFLPTWERSELSLATTPYLFNSEVDKTTLSCEYTSLRAVGSLIMRVNKPTFAYKLAQLCNKNLKREPRHIIVKKQKNKTLNKDQLKHANRNKTIHVS